MLGRIEMWSSSLAWHAQYEVAIYAHAESVYVHKYLYDVLLQHWCMGAFSNTQSAGGCMEENNFLAMVSSIFYTWTKFFFFMSCTVPRTVTTDCLCGEAPSCGLISLTIHVCHLHRQQSHMRLKQYSNSFEEMCLILTEERLKCGYSLLCITLGM